MRLRTVECLIIVVVIMLVIVVLVRLVEITRIIDHTEQDHHDDRKNQWTGSTIEDHRKQLIRQDKLDDRGSVRDEPHNEIDFDRIVNERVERILDEECNRDIVVPDQDAVFPQYPLSMEELKLCDDKQRVMLAGSMFCPNDTSCMQCSRNTSAIKFNKIKEGFDKPGLSRQRLDLLGRIRRNQPNERYPVVVMFSANYGQLYFLYNWACVLLKRHNIDPRTFTIVLPTDPESGKSLEERGFMTQPYSWINESFAIRKFYSGKAQLCSALIAAKHLMVLSTIEYLKQNMTVFFQDVDVVWNKDPRPFLKRFSCRQDLIGMVASRRDSQGFVNGGLFYVRPTRKSRVFFQTLENMMVWDTDDQTAFNALLRHHWFSEFNWRVAPASMFQNRVPQSSTKSWRERIKREALLVHAISTPKVDQFERVDMWDYSQDRCPEFFDPDIIMPEEDSPNSWRKNKK